MRLVLKHSSLTLEHRLLGMGSNGVFDALYSRQLQISFIILSSHLLVLHQITLPFFLHFLLSFILSFFPSFSPSFFYILHLHTRLVASCRKTWTWYWEHKLALALSTCILTMFTNRHTINNWLFVFHKIWTVLRYCLSNMNFIIFVCMEHNNKHSSALSEEERG